MTISYSPRFLIVAFVLATFALTPLVTLAGGGGGGVRSNATLGQFDSAPLTNNSGGQGSICTADAKLCPDGSYVGRTGPSCQFAACPTGNGTSTPPNGTSTQGVVCTMDAKICPDGRSVGRVAPSCNFAACPTATSTSGIPPVVTTFAQCVAAGYPVREKNPRECVRPDGQVFTEPTTSDNACAQDAKMCPDGSFVTRTGLSCSFPACPSEYVYPNNMGTPGAVGDSGTYIPPLFGGGGNTSGSGMTNDSGTVSNTGNNAFACPLDAKMCPDGSFVGRVGASCQFATCPTATSTSTSTPNTCPSDAKRCPGGTYVGRTGPSCTFAACPIVTPTTPPAGPGATTDSGWRWPSFSLIGGANNSNSNQNNVGTDSGSLNPFINNVVAPVASALTTAINPAFNMFSNAAEFGWDSVASNQNTPTPLFVNFAGINVPTTDSGAAIARPRSTSTLQTLLDRIYRRNQATSTTAVNIPGASGDSILGGGGSKPNSTNTIAFEVKVMAVNGDIITNWSTSTAVTVPTGGQLQFRWTASDYTQCLPFFNDNGQYALKAKNRIMTIGNTETEGYNVPEVSGNYRIECGGQKNDESGVDERSVTVTGPGTTVPPLFGGGVSNDGGTISNTDPFTGGSSNTGAICTQEAKRCPDGSYVSRTGPNCSFAACPTATNTNPTSTQPTGQICAQDAKVCPDGSYVTRTGPNCSFAACPTTTNQSGALDGSSNRP